MFPIDGQKNLFTGEGVRIVPPENLFGDGFPLLCNVTR